MIINDDDDDDDEKDVSKSESHLVLEVPVSFDEVYKLSMTEFAISSKTSIIIGP